MTPDLPQLRRLAISHTLSKPTSLRSVIERLGFVQADPIRSPARAQDLILRHRVVDYRAGDLERRYSALDLEEDHLFVYGFLPHRTWRLLHPRAFDNELSELELGIIKAFEADGSLDSRELEERFGAGRGMNPWGSYSRATQLALDQLHHRGLLRVVRRDRGNRVYELTPAVVEALPPGERLRELAMVVANLLAPLPKQTFMEAIARLRHSIRSKEITAGALVKAIVDAAELVEVTVEGMPYLLLPGSEAGHRIQPKVRLLAPFDPLVWDRRRFEHLWGWPYRFEAYTPAAKRLRGYYAMPLLWRDAMVGWANVSASKGRLNIELGFVDGRPDDTAFEHELEAEVERLRVFLQPRD